jgi:hypothetical protein
MVFDASSENLNRKSLLIVDKDKDLFKLQAGIIHASDYIYIIFHIYIYYIPYIYYTFHLVFHIIHAFIIYITKFIFQFYPLQSGSTGRKNWAFWPELGGFPDLLLSRCPRCPGDVGGFQSWFQPWIFLDVLSLYNEKCE